MKKILAVCLVAILLMVVGVGCVPTAPAPAAATPAINLQTMNTDLTTLKTWSEQINSWKVNTVDPLVGKVNRGEVGGGGVTKAEVDSLKSTITAQDGKITDLTTRLTTAENTLKSYTSVASSGSGGIVTNSGTGQATQFTPGTLTTAIPTSPTGGIVSQVNWVQGTSQVYTAPTGSSNQIWYVQRLMNQSTTIQYVRPMITFGVSSQYGYSTSSYFTGMNINISSPQGSVQAVYNPAAWGYPTTAWPMTGASNYLFSSIGTTQSATAPYAPTGTMYVTLAPGLGQITNSMLIMPTAGLSNGLGEFYISPGGYVDITVMLQGVYTNTASMWNVSASYSSHT